MAALTNDAPLASATTPLAQVDVSDPRLFESDAWQPVFARLRAEDPVHYCAQSRYGPYWSVSRYQDCMQVELNHQVFSSASELGGIQIEDQTFPKRFQRRSFYKNQ